MEFIKIHNYSQMQCQSFFLKRACLCSQEGNTESIYNFAIQHKPFNIGETSEYTEQYERSCLPWSWARRRQRGGPQEQYFSPHSLIWANLHGSQSAPLQHSIFRISCFTLIAWRKKFNSTIVNFDSCYKIIWRHNYAVYMYHCSRKHKGSEQYDPPVRKMLQQGSLYHWCWVPWAAGRAEEPRQSHMTASHYHVSVSDGSLCLDREARINQCRVNFKPTNLLPSMHALIGVWL